MTDLSGFFATPEECKAIEAAKREADRRFIEKFNSDPETIARLKQIDALLDGAEKARAAGGTAAVSAYWGGRTDG